MWQVPAGADKSEQWDYKWTGMPYCEAVVRKLLSKTLHMEDCKCIQAFKVQFAEWKGKEQKWEQINCSQEIKLQE